MPGARRSRRSGKAGRKREVRQATSRAGSTDGGEVRAERFEAEVLPGLAPLAAGELERLGAEVGKPSVDAIPFGFAGPVTALLGLRLSVAIYRVLDFDVPRPKALLGHEHFTRLARLVKDLAAGPPAQSFDGLRFGAAGSDSSVFTRLAAALAEATGLERKEEGELVLRFRPAPEGWEVLARITPRPLSARSWRACNIAGGLNATVAAAGVVLLGGSARERHLNLMCGSGTLLIERGLAGKWSSGVGIDLDPYALECARQNLEAAGLGERAQILAGDANELPFADASFDRISVDLPWGDAVGGHEANVRLYPAFLKESARVATAEARMLVITHEIRLFGRVLDDQTAWRALGEPLRVFHGGHRPGLYLLERSARSRVPR